MKKALFIFNPYTGGNKIKLHLLDILQVFAEAGYEVTVHPTQGPGDAKKTAADYGIEYDLVICCGGDGTLNETVSGLVQHKKPPVLGYIPGGTTNDYATSLGLPKTSMVAAAKRIVEPNEIFHSDVGVFGDRNFNYVAAFGAFTDVAYSTNQNVKNALGYLAYIFEVLGRLNSLPTIVASVECDGEMLDGEFVFGMISNSTSIGGIGFNRTDLIHMDDGLFELVLVRQPQKLADFTTLYADLMRKNIENPHIEVRQGKCFHILSEEPVSWTLDGEDGGSSTDTLITLKHKAISICI
ncbi:YegS/Rv2252/BmrU family lipid kinase [Ruminococcaceae bacterium OttesenSCG-928-I18]|nr:YegS/Rv2252/BmrU family lipid kinase [Ruminococcaceae bacterium OttesenSCG-928-I18]